MKDHFIQLFNYDHYANLIIAETITKANNTEKAVELMAHLLAAQQVWLSRCKGEQVTGQVLWPDWKADTFEQLISDNHSGWINFLEQLSPGDLEKSISYKNLKGDPFENKLIDILTHVINHGTHHRAQAVQQLKFDGVDALPLTDYIAYIRIKRL
jgi:uncharacterized damage-inducible protein DinB